MTNKSVIFGFGDGTTTIPANDHAYMTCTEEVTLSYEPKTERRKCVGAGVDGGGKPSITGSDVGGDMTLGANYEDIGLALKMALGDPVTVANGAVFDHTFTTADGVLPWVWFQLQRVDDTVTLDEQYTGLKADTLEVGVEADGLNNVKIALKGGEYLNSELGDTITANDSTNLHTLGTNDMPFIQGKLQIEIGGVLTDACWLSKFTLKIENNQDVKDLICGKKDVTVTAVEISGDYEGKFNHTAYQAIFSKDNSKSVKGVLTFESGTNKLVYTMDEITFNFKSEPVKYGESMIVQGSWAASKKAGSTEQMKVVLTNGVADYNL